MVLLFGAGMPCMVLSSVCIHTDAAGIDPDNLSRCQLHRLPGGVQVTDGALPQVQTGHGSIHAIGAGVAASFIVDEVEQLVFLDRAAPRSAEYVYQQRCDRHAGLVAEKRVGRGLGPAPVFIQRPVKFVGAGLGHQHDVGTRAASRAGVAIRCGGAKFFHRIERHAQHAGKRRARILIVYVSAVQSDIALVGLAAVHRAAAIILRADSAGRGAEGSEAGYARLKGQQAGDVAREHRHLDNRVVVDGVAERRIGGVHLRRGGLPTCTVVVVLPSFSKVIGTVAGWLTSSSTRSITTSANPAAFAVSL